jgi:excisionase family DNA binding protein
MSETAQTTDIEDRVDAVMDKVRALLFDALSFLWIDPKMFYRVSKAAELLDMPYRKLLKAVNDGDIPYIQYGSRTYRIKGQALIDYAQKNPLKTLEVAS